MKQKIESKRKRTKNLFKGDTFGFFFYAHWGLGRGAYTICE
jgi:hypothetical protein